MLPRILFVEDIKIRYKCSDSTARRIIRSLEHMEKPLGVYETVLAESERKRTVLPPEVVKQRLREQKAREQLRKQQEKQKVAARATA